MVSIKKQVASQWRHTTKLGTPEHEVTEHGALAEQRNNDGKSDIFCFSMYFIYWLAE